MMKVLTKMTLLGATLTLGALGLTGCGTAAAPTAADGVNWYNTDLGSVQCLTSKAAYGYQTTSCNWQTLQSGEAKVNAAHLDGDYRNLNGERVYCLENQISHGYTQYDCNWQAR